MNDDRAPWEWRKASGGWLNPTDRPERVFHACDVNGNLACDRGSGIGATVEEPTEGSTLCPACIPVVAELPAGRDKVDHEALRAAYWEKVRRG